VITTALSTVIGAARSRVWRAISNPDEMLRWDEPMLALLEPADDYPCVGTDVRWRYRSGGVSLLLRDRPLEVVPEQRLRSAVALGSFRFEQTWTLVDEAGDEPRTRLGLKLAAANTVPVLGETLDRFAVRRMAAEYVDAKLHGVQKWCEVDASGSQAPR
jgi:uncharacterized protein YndB with AHSA1/START domain